MLMGIDGSEWRLQCRHQMLNEVFKQLSTFQSGTVVHHTVSGKFGKMARINPVLDVRLGLGKTVL